MSKIIGLDGVEMDPDPLENEEFAYEMAERMLIFFAHDVVCTEEQREWFVRRLVHLFTIQEEPS